MKAKSGIFIMVLLLAISGCSKDEPTATGGIGLQSSFLMPDSVGQSWHYNGYKMLLLYDTLGNRTDSSRCALTLNIKVIRRDSINGYQTFTTELAYHADTSSLWWGPEDDTGRVRYAQNDTVLAELAYSVSGIVGPKRQYLGCICFMGKAYKDIEDLRNAVIFGTTIKNKYDTTLISFDPPRILLDYPLWRGKEWVHYNTAWLSNRRVECIEPTIVDGQTCFGWKVRSLLDIDGDGNWDTDIIWYDWYNGSGMLKRNIEMRGMMTNTAGEITGTFIDTEYYELANP